ncbi:MAG: polyphenol oxidase family protein [bacterium]|nr:polyphenol oxidase family protein [bacterium]
MEIVNNSSSAPFIYFNNLAEVDGITHAVSTRQGPAFGQVGTDAATAQAAAECARVLKMSGTAWAHQVHGKTILKVSAPGLAGQADALISNTPGLLLAGRSADCPIVLVSGHDTAGKPAVGFAHASWRSTVQNITQLLIAKLTDSFSCQTESFQAAIAPSAGPCCYEVGQEVRDQALKELGPIAAKFFKVHQDRWIFDLWSANVWQLLQSGVSEKRIECTCICTMCQGDNFWSWRRQGPRAGRFAGLIGVTL